MLPILFSDTGATSQDGSHSAIFRMQGPEGCDILTQLKWLLHVPNIIGPENATFLGNSSYYSLIQL